MYYLYFYVLQTVFNAPVLTGDFIGLTVTDNSGGLPVGWEQVPGQGHLLYINTGISSEGELPQPGRAYTSYSQLNIQNKFALTVYASDGTSVSHP